jgi:hypothetical protein
LEIRIFLLLSSKQFNSLILLHAFHILPQQNNNIAAAEQQCCRSRTTMLPQQDNNVATAG